MLIALVYFEWRTLLKCFGSCKDKICGKGAQRQIGFVDDHNGGDHKLSDGSEGEDYNDDLDQDFAKNLARLDKKHNDSYGEPHVGFDEYASNR